MTADSGSVQEPTSRVQDVARIVLGAFIVYAGISHLTWSRTAFHAQVPDWIPVLSVDAVVIISGVVEIALGGSLILLTRHRAIVGWVAAAFFVAVFPGNISQFVDHDAAFGLDTDAARAIRLVFQPVLVAWALWSTGAWSAWRAHRGAPPETPRPPDPPSDDPGRPDGAPRR